MPLDRLMSICLVCDHCRITFDQRDLDIVSGDHKNLKYRVTQLFNRDKIKDIWCAKGMIRDTDGVPRIYHSNTAIKSAAFVEGSCPYYSGEDEVDDS